MDIIKTIGPGCDYADLGLWWNWVKLQTPLAAEYIAVISGDFTEGTGIAGTGPVFAGHTVMVVDIARTHTITTNYAYTFNDNGNAADLLDVVTLQNLTIVCTNTAINLLSANTQYASRYMSARYVNLTLIGASVAGSSRGIALNRWGNSDHITNCRITGFYTAVGLAISDANTAGTDHVVENCALYNNGNGIITGSSSATKNVTVRNTSGVGNTGYDFKDGGAASAYHSYINCYDSDNSLAALTGVVTSPRTGATTADYLSVTPASSDFLKIDDTSHFFEVGTTSISAWNTADFDGNPRPEEHTLLVSVGITEPIVNTGSPCILIYDD